jgi:hypothetical protein
MKSSKNLAQTGLMLAVAAVVGIGSYAAARPLLPRPCICPMVYAPVLCPNGQVYGNSCFASCEGQTNCVPFWPEFETE